MLLSQEDHAKVSAAVTAAERKTDGEIVTMVAARSDAYSDVGFAWAALAMLAVPAAVALLPVAWIERVEGWLLDWDEAFTRGALMAALAFALALVFLLVRALLAWDRLRIALTPRPIKARRVHARAIDLFRAGCESRTRGRTGILVFLSLAEHRAEILADQAIASQVEPEIWGEAMAAMIDEVKAGRPGEGMAAAVDKVGEVLARILPASGTNPNELCDRLVEL